MTERRVTRRKLLIGTAAVAGGGLVLSWLVEDADERSLAEMPGVLEPNAHLQITPGGAIILQVDKLEMGQGVMTGFVTMLAEELAVRPDQIAARHAPVHAYFQDPTQVTAESRSIRARWEPIRKTGATARDMLIRAAAKRWRVERADVTTPGDGTVINELTAERLSYGELATEAARIGVAPGVALKPHDQYQWIGKHVPRPEIPAKVTGELNFGIDSSLPDMMIAVVVHSPQLLGRVSSYDATDAERSAGVHRVVEIHSGIAVVAETFWHASQAARKLQIDWADSPLAGTSVAAIHDKQRELLDTEDGIEARHDGNVGKAFTKAATIIYAEYALPFLAHATMEPMNATVQLSAEQCDIWVATQGPDLTRQLICGMTGLSRHQVHVHTLFAGGGFGRRALNDHVAEAVAIALRIDYPVKLIWSREDDMRNDYFRGATMHRIRAALDKSGRPVGWEHRLVAANLIKHILPPGLSTLAPEWLPDGVIQATAELGSSAFAKFLGPFQARDGAATIPYEFENLRVETLDWDPGVPVGIWRSVGNHYNSFAIETFIDELAHHANADPMEYRRQYLVQSPRHLRVLERLATESNWGFPASGQHQGIAIHECYGTVVGQVAEISIDQNNSIAVQRVTCVVDCGIAINPDIVRGQMESGIIFGLTAALYGEIEIENGYVKQSNFHDYRMLRMSGTPEINVYIIDSDASPGGVGEPGTPPIAPAVNNAVFSATGKRLRELPLRL
jgi:isoquinoline 1-oxidoreductase/isoquinoline 1-oxidoreductase beta subunit